MDFDPVRYRALEGGVGRLPLCEPPECPPPRLHHVRSNQLCRLVEYDVSLTTKSLTEAQVTEALSLLRPSKKSCCSFIKLLLVSAFVTGLPSPCMLPTPNDQSAKRGIQER